MLKIFCKTSSDFEECSDAFIYKIKNLNEWVDSFYIFGECMNE